MKQILLQTLVDTSKMITSKSKSGLTEKYWFWIAAAEFGVVLFLATKLWKKQKPIIDTTTKEIFKSSKNMTVDMDNVMNSIHKSKELYKKLSAKCHPDRFMDTEQNKKASDIFQEITKGQKNYSRLLELKELAENELNITI